MKRVIVTLLSIMMFGQIFARDHNIKCEGIDFKPKIEIDREAYIYKDHNDVIIENEDEDQDVMITKNYELYVNGERVKTNHRQQDLLVEYYQLTDSVYDKVKEIGIEGMKVGLKGAELGIKAATGVFRILLPGYSADDFENDMDKAAKKVEKKAEKLEQKADVLEKMVDHLEDIHDELRESVKELEDLEWF